MDPHKNIYLGFPFDTTLGITLCMFFEKPENGHISTTKQPPCEVYLFHFINSSCHL